MLPFLLASPLPYYSELQLQFVSFVFGPSVAAPVGAVAAIEVDSRMTVNGQSAFVTLAQLGDR